jgi:type I site-specific restriction endonuclease
VRGAPLLSSVDPFDLAVIDEAHEIFSGIYKRFNRLDEYVDESKQAQTAHRVRNFLNQNRTPVLTSDGDSVTKYR